MFEKAFPSGILKRIGHAMVHQQRLPGTNLCCECSFLAQGRPPEPENIWSLCFGWGQTKTMNGILHMANGRVMFGKQVAITAQAATIVHAPHLRHVRGEAFRR